MLRLNACVCVCVCVRACVRVEVLGMVGELKATWEKFGRTIRMVWTRTGVRQEVLLCSSLELGQIFYALEPEVFGKFIKRACSEINWRWLIESCVWCRQLEVITLAEGAGWTCRGSIRLARAEERSCWRAGNRVSLTGTGGEIQAMAAGGSVTPRRGRKVQKWLS